MIDAFFDELSLDFIKSVSPEENVLVFKNHGKDETLVLALDGKELTNVYRKIRMRLETLGLKKEGEELR